MHPVHHAKTRPEAVAVQMADGRQLTYRALDEASNRAAHLFRALGLQAGDCIALMIENRPEFLELCWAAQRAGLYWTCLSTRLVADEAEYILADSGAKLFVTTRRYAPLAAAIASRRPNLPLYMIEAEAPFDDLAEALAPMPVTPIADQRPGIDMLYSSGTTGRPKGIRPALPEGDIAVASPLFGVIRNVFGIGEGEIYLCPAPLYHAAPLRWSMNLMRLGGTVVLMERFDAEAALALIERYRITCGQFVPTHFVRMLKLPDEVRRRYDVSSMRCAVHAAAPCPVRIKQAMIDWWGPVIDEYYAGTEGIGICAILAEDWLAHPGSVGRAVVGEVRVCDEAGEPLPPRAEGLIHFEGGPKLTYHNDPEKTRASHNHYGWASLGDVGWVDEEGYLYLTDRKSFTIISGGVNIYPQEIENLLVSHPQIADAAVIGAPDPDLGERVTAIIQPLDMGKAGEELAQDILGFCRANLSILKVPRSVEFRADLPRTPTGKLLKRLLRDEFWDKADV